MSEFRFAEPGWGLLLWAVLALTALLWWLDARSPAAMARLLSPLMQDRLAEVRSPSRRRLSIALLGLSLAAGVVALMRPQWGLQLVATPRIGAEIMVCLDVSNSMLAEDVAPNRLERAKAELRDLLGYLRGDSVGLIAFAGRASVLAPITPDFSFLRMVLDSAGPHSVSRGGTRLEEPIRKAIAGFGAGASVSRSILLITDGEDHDSFPLEAAKDAAERGIRVLAIGFGDEAGSPIQITDPKTGAKKTLRDANGQEVRTRLDGDTLRKIALATGGAYVPAGTGVLDLESIYDRHIASLTRGELDGESRAIRSDAYQWAVLASLLLLVASVAVGAGGARRTSAASGVATRAGARTAAALALLLALPVADRPSHAQTTAGPPAAAAAEPSPDAAAPDATTTDATSADASAKEDDTRPPRAVYNDALDRLGTGDLDAAEKLFEKARSRAGTDGELRRDASYDLGVLEARRADAKMEGAPEDALAALERSAAWFRETVSLDAADADARHNLELVLRRALVLADAIAKKNEKPLLEEITARMEDQRGFLAALRDAVQSGGASPTAAAAEADTPAAAPGADPGSQREAFRDLATQQLALSSKAEDVSERALREQALIRARPADQQTPEEAMKAVQLDGVLEALHHAREQMGQARGRLRRLEGAGAYRAASTTLTNLKRARDRLLDPVQVLDILVGDAMELARLTGVRIALDSGRTDLPPQKWLTPEHLADGGDELRERIEELHYDFVTVLSQADAAAANGQAPDAKGADLVERVREAEPLIGEAAARMAAAKSELDSARVRESVPPQYDAIAKLAAARESFLDFQRLVELAFEEEKRVQQLLSPPDAGQAAGAGSADSAPATPQAARSEYAAPAAELQRTNTARAPRLERARKQQLAAAEETIAAAQAQQADSRQQAGQAPPAADASAQAEAEKQRLELAGTYLAAATGALDEARSKLDALAAEAASLGAALPAESWTTPTAAVAEAVARLEDLRRLFFSVLDHLKELAGRQLELGDQTEETRTMASAAPDRDWTNESGPLASRQQTLETKAAPIAEALREQSKQPAPPDQPGTASQQDLPQKLAQAADHVDAARGAMQEAGAGLTVNPPAFADARTAQTRALEELAEAIRLLTPPEQQQQQQQQNEEQQEQQQEQQAQQGGEPQQQGGGQQAQQKKQEEQEKTDPAQLLQGVRDREAERRANKDKAQQQGYEPVEKDW